MSLVHRRAKAVEGADHLMRALVGNSESPYRLAAEERKTSSFLRWFVNYVIAKELAGRGIRVDQRSPCRPALGLIQVPG